MMASEVLISPNVISIGNSHFLRECAIPTAEDIESIAALSSEAPTFGSLDDFNSAKPRADALTFTFIGLVAGVSSWIGFKVLNDIYAETLGKKVRSCIKRIVESSPSQATKSVALVISNLKYGSTVVIAVSGTNEQELLQAESNIPSAIAAIMSLPADDKQDSSVYLYELVGTKLNLEPRKYDSVGEAVDSIPKSLSHES